MRLCTCAAAKYVTLLSEIAHFVRPSVRREIAPLNAVMKRRYLDVRSIRNEIPHLALHLGAQEPPLPSLTASDLPPLIYCLSPFMSSFALCCFPPVILVQGPPGIPETG